MDPCLINPPYYTHFDTHISPYYIDFNTHTSFHILLKNTYRFYPIFIYFLPILTMHPSWHLIFRLSLLGYIFVIYIQKGGKVVAKDPGPTCMGSKKWFPQEKVLRKRRSSMHFVAFHFSPTQFRRRWDIAKGTMDQRVFANGTALTWFFSSSQARLWIDRKPFLFGDVTSTIKKIFIFQVV